MARYRGATCKLSRRYDVDLLTKSGVRDHKSKCHAEKRPGEHGDKRPRLSDYGLQLLEKQKIKFYYRRPEKQFRNLYKAAAHQKGATGQNLMIFLERCLDNVVYRMGFATTRAESRQLVSHCAVLVNDCVVNIPSYKVKIGDIVSIRQKARNQGRIQAALALSQQRAPCDWLTVDAEAFKGTLTTYPNLTDLSSDYNVNLVVELYSK